MSAICPSVTHNLSYAPGHKQTPAPSSTITTASMAETATTPSSSNRQNNKSGSRPPSRPHTPLRRSSRGSLVSKTVDDAFPLNALEPAFAELSDAVTTLEVNMADMQIMHDSLSRFSESFASFLYGLNMNAFCVDFTEVCLSSNLSTVLG